MKKAKKAAVVKWERQVVGPGYFAEVEGVRAIASKGSKDWYADAEDVGGCVGSAARYGFKTAKAAKAAALELAKLVAKWGKR